MRRLLAKLLLLMLMCVPALAEGPDLSLLTYDVPETDEATVQGSETSSRVIPIDLWMDGSENMGGINSIPGSIYTGNDSSLYSGGFHYDRVSGNGSVHGWYEDILSELTTLMGDKQATVRVLRYGDEVYSAETLVQAGLATDASDTRISSLQRDLMTWTTQADAHTFHTMVAEGAASFYAVGSSALNRVATLDTLENLSSREALSAVQADVLARAAEGDNAVLVDRTAGDSHLLHALDALDTNHLSIITLDTWSLGDPTAERMGQLVDLYREKLASLGLFDQSGLSATFFALRLDYVGSITSYASLKPQEALHWGRLTPVSGTNTVNECAMPRCMLMLLIGRPDEVSRVADRLQTYFDTDETLNDPTGRGYQRGDGAVTLVNYFYGGQKFQRTAFNFAYVRSDVAHRQVTTLTEHDKQCSLTLNGNAADASLVTIHPNADGAYDDQTITLTVQLGADVQAIMPSAEEMAQTAVVTVESSLMLDETLPNAPDTMASLLADGVQIIPQRESLYVFREHAPVGMRLDALCDGNTMTFLLTLPGETLTPGYVTLTLTSTLASGEATQSDPFAWVEGQAETGDAVAAIWNYETGESLPKEWLEMPEAIASAKGENRKTLVNGMRHAWCVGNQQQTLGRIPDIPPVFRLLNAGRLTAAFQYAALLGDRIPVRYTLTIFVDNQ